MQNNILPNNIVYEKQQNKDIESSNSDIPEKNFLNGLKNARGILERLEKSIHKSKEYEKRILQCKVTPANSHREKRRHLQQRPDENTETSFKTATATDTDPKSGWGRGNFADPCSTMSMVCLQYQYEELSKRYESLLRAYDVCCNTLAHRDEQIAQASQRADDAHAQVLQAHNAVLNVGARFLAVKRKKHLQRMFFETKVRHLKEALHDVLHVAEQARKDLDTELARKLDGDQDSVHTALLNEIRKCNHLSLENMQLQAKFKSLRLPNEQDP